MELVPIFSRPTGCTRKPGTHRFPINSAHPHPRASSNNSSDFLFLHFFQIPIPFCFCFMVCCPNEEACIPVMPRTTDQNYGQTDVVVLTTVPTTVVSGPLQDVGAGSPDAGTPSAC
jgi:hypothetical protein